MTIDVFPTNNIVENVDDKERCKKQGQGKEDDKEASTKKKCSSCGGTDHQRSSSKLYKAGKKCSSYS
eukprot:4028079-Ditylum_brightwellii.AAC.2